MEKVRWTVIAVALGSVCLLLAAGCGVTQGTQPPPPQSAPTQPPPVAGSTGSISLRPAYVALHPGDKVQFAVSGAAASAVTWLVDGVQGGNAGLGTIDASGNYTAPASVPQSANFTITAELTASPQKNNATSVASVINYGSIYPTANSQVVEYSIYLPVPGKVAVNFGPNTSYGRNTWQVPTPTPYGGQVNVLVAGMLAQTLYHMQAQVALNDGATWADADHAQFSSGQPLTMGSPPTTSAITMVTNTSSAQPGIEMWNTILPSTITEAFATDLSGNVLWTYTYQGSTIDEIQSIRLLPTGNFVMAISYLSSLTQPAVNRYPGTINLIREVDLAGTTVHELSMDQLNQEIASAGFHDAQGNPYQLGSFHHDVLPLPNGHLILLADEYKTFTNLPGQSGPVKVLGDILVDVDQNLNPDWVWSGFDHLDINRHPMYFPDWTHSNDVLYSADDHDLLLSMRHQNWIIKIDFNDGKGSGNILWHLGYQGDFQLLDSNGQVDNNPADWFYAQHGMNFFSPTTAGVFRLGLMDNGNDRFFAPPTGQVICKPYTPGSAQCYSTFPVLEINESNMTATIVSRYMPPPSQYSFFGGNAMLLANGDAHVNFCAALAGSVIQEFNPSGTQVVWQATTPKAYQFRVNRIGSLYPGVQW